MQGPAPVAPAAPGGGPDPAGRRWAVLAAGVVAITAGCTFQFGLAYLIPHFTAEGLSLPESALLVACPGFGLLATLIAWGAAADRWGERFVLAAGLLLAAPALGAAALYARQGRGGLVASGVCLVVAGAAGASVHAASGRLILGWFAARERGLAMGIRQTAQPLGVGVAAASLPVLATHGTSTALAVLGAACLAAALLVAVVVRDPPRRVATAGPVGGSPYQTPVLWRIHLASALLVVPQFTVATFGLAFLVQERGWSPVAGGWLLALAQLGGASARLGAGWWSDRAGSRVGPLRLTAVAVAASLGLLALTAGAGSDLTAGALVLAAVITVSPNGLAFTAVAEYAGQSWAGRALGIQNTGQNVVAALTPRAVAPLIVGHGYPAAFTMAAGFPLLALVLVPTRIRDRSLPGVARANPPGGT